MKTLVKHLWETNRHEIVTRSRANCHAKGLHSIMLAESPGKTIRLFLADWNHDLHTNSISSYNREPWSVAVHSHHCPVTLTTVLGLFVNERMYMVRDRVTPSTYGWPTAQQFIFDSKLLGGTGGFAKGQPGEFAYQPASQSYAVGQSVQMTAKDLHTVFVPKEERAAWLVFEGPSDPDFKPVAYSNRDLTTWTPEGLYQPAEEKQIERWLRISNLL